MVGICQDFVAGNTSDVGDKAHTTGILFEGGVIQTLFRGQPGSAIDSLVHHASNLSGDAIKLSVYLAQQKPALMSRLNRGLSLFDLLPATSDFFMQDCAGQKLYHPTTQSQGFRRVSSFYYFDKPLYLKTIHKRWSREDFVEEQYCGASRRCYAYN